MIVAATRSVGETRALAAALAELARPGDLVVLAGDLGAGKTAFVQGYGAELGVTERITSPTFTILSSYQGRLPLHHLDVYRLDQVEEAYDLGLAELLDEGGVTLIEWGDTILPALPTDYLEIRFLLGDHDDDRRLELVGVGARWAARTRALRTALRPWLVDDAQVGEAPTADGGAPC
ncbi:MAG: tRNA (adenosine(37)-N6)-threonylcarbamoyltransferase complex ATPase subunit type 1 TsaE [Acidimicrobiales bacterium]|nr:tRNA (adenosine(37)-N6)-threonylcarbamoyltransferase complex ATPase subunit type 1 TsaE [Acidimicrobiales bacterium]